MLQIEVAPVEHCRLYPHQERFLDRGDLRGADVVTYVASMNGAKIGCAALHHMHLLYFAIDAQYQGRGLGRQFMTLLLTIVPRMTLRVHPDNHAALHLYTTLGFTFDSSPDSNGEVLGRRLKDSPLA